ncbi:penicillin-binding protein activator [Ectothiorhodospira sp. A-7R]|uniref:penicillin-binding protein activator n=1 Tax=Ectothiorhodospira lacustris TaxID=2899127 RepID=UPI001EE7D4F3|nr:penicillin-binding protein activator [Ectothiorhodospira lacustris]MCG5521219.1 penicillin-binding protein activator [Ectothiorhodospira lacustris]
MRHIVLPLLIALFLSACAGLPRPADPPTDALAHAALLEQEGSHLAAAAAYLDAAARLRGADRARVQLNAADLMLRPPVEPDALDQASRVLGQVESRHLDAAGKARYAELNARITWLEGDPQTALSHLPPSLDNLPSALVARILETQAGALADQGRWHEALETRIRQGALYQNPEERLVSQEALWAMLQQIPVRQLPDLAARASRFEARGWLSLAELAHDTPPRLSALETRLDAWHRQFDGHPAAPRFLNRLREQWAAYGHYPEHVAVLLPLTGRFSTAAQAILEGVIAAYYDSPADNRPELRIHDTGEQAESAWTHYQQAIADGARGVIGPLDRNAVTLFAQRESLPIPILALNHADPQSAYPAGLYQFGLNPETEATQAAERAILEGRRRAIILMPRTELGERLQRTFRDRFEALGGQVVSTQFFAPEASDYGASIIAALDIRDRSGRTGRDARPTPREDVDLIFLSGSPRQARLLWPQLRFHRAGQIPVLTTSHVYSGRPDPRHDQDLDGLVFADIPWLLEGANPRPELRSRLDAQLSGNTRQLPRLVALGFDALQLFPLLGRLADHPSERYQGLTGGLRMDASGHITRDLNWARFIDGRPRLVGQTDLPVADQAQ